ncbi:hypothetical protein ACLIA0_04675 [Bacillaceae bacterium W0354]
MIQEGASIQLPKRNMYLVVLLSIVTVAVYIGFWFLRNKEAFKQEKNHYIPFKWWVVCTAFLLLSFLHLFVGGFIFTPYGLAYMESFNIVLTYLFIALLYYSIFRVKELLEREYEDLYLNKYLLFFFHIWYLQYKINKLDEVNEMERVA